MNKEAVGDPDSRDMVDNPDSPKKDGRDNENEALDADKTANTADSPDHPTRDGDELKKAVGETYNNLKKRPTKRLKDISPVSSTQSVGYYKKK